MYVQLMKLLLLLNILLFSLMTRAANDASQSFTLDGQLFHAGSNTPLIDGGAKLNVQILDPSQTCVLYEETQNINTISTNGFFSIQVGSLPGNPKRSGLDAGQTMGNIVQNISAIPASNAPGKTCVSATYSPSAGDTRYFRITVIPSSGTPDVLTPDMVLDSVPSAIVAQSVQGLDRSSILHTNTTVPVGEVLTQANLESLFTAAAFANLAPILAGNYVQKGTGGAVLPSFPSAPASPIAGDIWYDSTGKQLVFSDGTANHVLGTTAAGVTSITTSSNLSVNGTAGATLTTTGTLDLATLGTAGTYPKVTVDAYGRVSAGSALLQTDIPTLSSAGKVLGSAINSGTIGGSTSINTSGNLQTTSDISSKRIFLFDHSGAGPNFVGMQTVNDISLGGASYTLTLPNSAGSPNQVLTTDGAGILSWTAGSDNSRVSKAGDTMTGLLLLSGNPVAAMGAAPKQYVDSNLIGKTLPAAPAAGQNGQALRWNNATPAWEYFTPATGTVTNVSSSNTDINVSSSTTTPVLTLNSGTGNNQIVKLSATAKLPAVDGSQLTNLGATQITTGLLPFNRGGTGTALAPFGKGEIIFSNSSADLTSLPGGPINYVLMSAGVGLAPTWASIPPDSTKVMKSGDTMSGLLLLSADPSAALGASTKQYVDSVVATSGAQNLKLSGGTMTGPLINNSNSASPALAVTQSGAGYAATFMGGNVGVGNVNPSSQLEVTGDITLSKGAARTIAVSNAAAATNGDSLTIKSGSATTGVPFGGGDLSLIAGNGRSVGGSGGNVLINAGTGFNYGNIILGATVGNVGVGTTPSAFFHIKAGDITAGSAPLKLTAGSNLTTPEPGAIEYDGTSLYFTDSSAARRTIASITPNLTNITSISNPSGNITLSPISNTGSVTISSNTSSISSTTGALVVMGGIGSTGDIFSGASINASTAISAGTYVLAPQIYGSYSAGGNVKIDGTSNATKGFVLLNSAGGNVGIGTTSPGASLEVVGTSGTYALKSTYSKAGGSYALAGINSGSGSNGVRGESTNAVGGYGVYGASTSGTAGYFTSATGYGLIVNSGNVGIGTNSPSNLLTVNGITGIGTGIIRFGGSNYGETNGINIGIGNTVGYSNSLGVGRNNNLGQGDATVLMGISNAINPSNGDQGIAFGISNTVEGGSVAIGNSNNTTGAANSVAIGKGITNNIASSLMIGPSDSAKTTILSSGNVGIGTSSPSALLSTKISAVSGVYQDATNSSGSKIFSFNDDGYGRPVWSLFDNASNAMFVVNGNNAGGPIVSINGSQTSLTDASGAGTSGANMYLRVPTSVGGENGIFFGDSPGAGNAGAAITHYISSTSLYGMGGLHFKTSSVGGAPPTRMTIDPTGNVGIGTNTPGGTLDVQGGTAAASTAGSNIQMTSQSGGTGNTNGGNIQLLPGSGNGTGGAGKIVLGNAANMQTSFGSIPANVNIWPTTARTQLLIATGGGQELIGLYSTAGSYLGGVDGSGRAFHNTLFGTYSASGNLTLDSTSNGTKGNIYIAPSGGNIGIGTSNPGSKLEVAGRVKVTGQLGTGSQTISGGTSAIDWDNGNSISTDYSCAGLVSFANLMDGGTYNLAVTDTGTSMCDFSTTTTGKDAATVSYRYRPVNAARSANTHTIYTFMRIGTVVYVSWASGF